MKNLRIYIFALGTFVASTADASVDFAGATFTVLPAAPAAGELVRIRYDSDTGCLWTGGGTITVDAESSFILVSMSFNDGVVVPCPATTTTPFMRDVGALPRGTYTVAYKVCGNAPPPDPPCQIVGSELLFVGGGAPIPVPAASRSLLGLLATSLLLPAAMLLRTGRRRSPELERRSG